MKPELSP